MVFLEELVWGRMFCDGVRVAVGGWPFHFLYAVKRKVGTGRSPVHKEQVLQESV
jgi:hypothetical protein